MDPIERVRNAVAHNRALSEKVMGNYEVARTELLTAIGEFFADLESRP